MTLVVVLTPDPEGLIETAIEMSPEVAGFHMQIAVMGELPLVDFEIHPGIFLPDA